MIEDVVEAISKIESLKGQSIDIEEWVDKLEDLEYEDMLEENM